MQLANLKCQTENSPLWEMGIVVTLVVWYHFDAASCLQNQYLIITNSSWSSKHQCTSAVHASSKILPQQQTTLEWSLLHTSIPPVWKKMSSILGLLVCILITYIWLITVLHFYIMTHTHTQPFYCWSRICPGPPGSAGTRKVKPRRLKPIWIYWSKR